MLETKNRYLIPLLINFITVSALLFHLIVLWKFYPFYVGGSFILTTVIAFIFYLSFVYKDYALPLSLFSFILLLIMALNFFAAYEYYHGYSTYIEITIGTLTVMVSILVMCLVSGAFKSKVASDPRVERIELKKRIFYIIYNIPMIIGICALSAGIALSGMRDNRIVRRECTPIFAHLSVAWIVIGILFVLYQLRKWDFLDAYISTMAVKKSEVNVTWLKKWFGSATIVIFLAGFGIEIQRGFWLLWFFSWLAFVMISIVAWKMWRFVFSRDASCTETNLDLERIRRLPSFSEPTYVIKLMLITSAVAFIQFLILAFLEVKYC